MMLKADPRRLLLASREDRGGELLDVGRLADRLALHDVFNVEYSKSEQLAARPCAVRFGVEYWAANSVLSSPYSLQQAVESIQGLNIPGPRVVLISVQGSGSTRTPGIGRTASRSL